jgi:hypothetical protein
MSGALDTPAMKGAPVDFHGNARAERVSHETICA